MTSRGGGVNSPPPPRLGVYPRGMTTRTRSALALLAFLAISFAAAGLGSIATASAIDGWYAEADKVAWTPPNIVFGPVWTVLYTLMSVAAWLVWRERDRRPVRRPLTWYVSQLALNAVWTPVFFGLYPVLGGTALWLAAAIVVALDVAILATLVTFARVRRLAAALLVPYLLWCLYASTLNVGLAVLNP